MVEVQKILTLGRVGGVVAWIIAVVKDRHERFGGRTLRDVPEATQPALAVQQDQESGLALARPSRPSFELTWTCPSSSILSSIDTVDT